MSGSRVVIFEGSPGAGKSSLSQYVAQKWEAAGHSPVWIEEHELNETWFGDFLDALDSGEGGPTVAALDCWRNLLGQAASDQRTYLIDGAYFHTVLKLLLAHGYGEEQIGDYLRQLHHLFQPHRPILVHLTGDVAATMQSVIAERGPRWAAKVAEQIADYPSQAGKPRTIAAMIDFFIASQAELERIATRYPFECVSIDTSARDWPSYQQALDQRLGLPQAEAAVGVQEASLADYVGVYNTPDGFPDEFRHPLEVELSEAGLRLHVVFMRNFRLVPAAEADHFSIAGRPLDLEFVRDETGQLTGLIYPFVPGHRFFCPKVR